MNIHILKVYTDTRAFKKTSSLTYPQYVYILILIISLYVNKCLYD